MCVIHYKTTYIENIEHLASIQHKNSILLVLCYLYILL